MTYNILPCVGYGTLARASRDVQDKTLYKFFNARWAFIVTWHNVTYEEPEIPRATNNEYQVTIHSCCVC